MSERTAPGAWQEGDGPRERVFIEPRIRVFLDTLNDVVSVLERAVHDELIQCRDRLEAARWDRVALAVAGEPLVAVDARIEELKTTVAVHEAALAWKPDE